MESVLPYQCSNAPSATVIAFNRPATSKENASDFVIDPPNLGMLVVDEDENVSVLQYNPLDIRWQI